MRPDLDGWLEALRAVVGDQGLLTGEAAAQAAFSPWGRLGRPAAIAYPRQTSEVAGVVRCAASFGVPVVPWGGGTGLVDGAFAEGAVALSLDRMRAVELVDAESGYIRAEAGCPLSVAADAARAAGCLLPLDLGARGSAILGG